jgi:hypothetical protein
MRENLISCLAIFCKGFKIREIGDEGIGGEFNAGDEVVVVVLTIVLFVVISGKVPWAMDMTTIPTVKVGVVPCGVIGLFRNISSGSSSVGNKPCDRSNLDEFLKFPNGADPISCGIVR